MHRLHATDHGATDSSLTSSDLSSLLSTATAVTVGVKRNAVQLHASTASSAIGLLSCGRPHAIKPPPPCQHLSASEQTPLPLVAWSNGRASAFGRCAFAVLRSTCSWWV